MKVGFIGTERDLNLRLEGLRKEYGKDNVFVLKGHNNEDSPKTIYTVETLIENTDIIFYGREAINNQTLLYHTIKEANKVFLDNDDFIPDELVKKCKAFHEEAGNIIAFNIAPYLSIFPEEGYSYDKPMHIYYQSMGDYDDILKKTYELAIIGCCFLGYSNLRSTFHILPGKGEKTNSICISMHNLKGGYYHMQVSLSGVKYEHYTIVDETKTLNHETNLEGVFSSGDKLKDQLNALYNNNVMGDLALAHTVSKTMERLSEIIKKRGFLSLNE